MKLLGLEVVFSLVMFILINIDLFVYNDVLIYGIRWNKEVVGKKLRRDRNFGIFRVEMILKLILGILFFIIERWIEILCKFM